MQFTNKTYDVLKWIAQYLLPASGTLYFALAGIWGLGYGEQVIGTITAVDIFLGVILGISSRSYDATATATDGVFFVDNTSSPGKQLTQFVFADDITALSEKEVLTIRVKTGVSLSDENDVGPAG